MSVVVTYYWQITMEVYGDITTAAAVKTVLALVNYYCIFSRLRCFFPVVAFLGSRG
jgi:hypothetical protein